MNDASLIPARRIERKILLLRGEKVMLDTDLAELYGVEARALNQAVKRNIERFPDDFMFQLSPAETKLAMNFQALTDPLNSSQTVMSSAKDLKTKGGLEVNSSQFVMSSKKHRGLAYRPYAFTEQGVAMLSSVLRSDRAIQVNLAIMRTFVLLRQMLATHADLARKLESLERKYDAKFRVVFDAIREMMDEKKKPKREIGFHTLMPKPRKSGGVNARRI
ncbi:MAG: ORF6N domain-containing protein [Pedosphaera sp.]|nr:ORF6N domain-containing protein [Pedosphaera sp.]